MLRHTSCHSTIHNSLKAYHTQSKSQGLYNSLQASRHLAYLLWPLSIHTAIQFTLLCLLEVPQHASHAPNSGPSPLLSLLPPDIGKAHSVLFLFNIVLWVRPSLTTYIKVHSPCLACPRSSPALFFSPLLISIWHTMYFNYSFIVCLVTLEYKIYVGKNFY